MVVLGVFGNKGVLWWLDFGKVLVEEWVNWVILMIDDFVFEDFQVIVVEIDVYIDYDWVG